MMQWTKEDAGKTLIWAVGCLMAAICLTFFPDALWRWWLSYPGALVLLALTAMMMMTAWDKKLDRIIADANGIEIQNKMLDMSFLKKDRSDLSPQESGEFEEMRHEKKVAWREVGAVKMVDSYVKRPHGRGVSNLEFDQRELVLYGHNGKVFMRLKDPLDPPEAYQRFLDSIPRWTKLTIQKVRENR
jgi:predicted amidohydrolase